jgi:hypothetical protein
MPRPNYKHSEETKRKIGLANSIAQKGRIIPKETRIKMSLAQRKRVKEGRHHLWRGGVSNLEVRAGRNKPDRCELCFDKSVKTCFDHDHKTGKFK